MKALFYGWLFGAPFLLIVGLVRRVAAPDFPHPAQAAHFTAVTGRYLIAALALNVAVPLIGMAVAWRIGEKAWAERFIRSLWWMAVVLLFQWAATSASGRPAGDEDPAPRVTHCIPISGGRQCPGG